MAVWSRALVLGSSHFNDVDSSSATSRVQVSAEYVTSTCTRIMINIISVNLLNNERMFTVKCGPINTTYAINSGRIERNRYMTGVIFGRECRKYREILFKFNLKCTKICCSSTSDHPT